MHRSSVNNAEVRPIRVTRFAGEAMPLSVAINPMIKKPTQPYRRRSRTSRITPTTAEAIASTDQPFMYGPEPISNRGM
jgi:hypothetical protein